MNNKKTTISIIVPVYNVEKYLEKCLDSILRQTFTEFELILVNDGSTDKSGLICDEYVKLDKRVKVIHKDNGGLSSARNAGLDIAQGKYIGFVDSDDYINKNMFSYLYESIKKYDADISICNFLYVQENENIYDSEEKLDLDKIKEFKGVKILEQLYESDILQFVISWNKLYKKELFNELRYEFGKLHEDEYIIHKILYRCKKVVYSPISLYYYAQRDGSIMNTQNTKKSMDSIMAYGDRINFFKTINESDLLQKAVDFYLKRVLVEYKKSQDNYINVFLSKSVRRTLYLILQNKNFSIKEKMAFVVFAISPKLYAKLIKS